MKGLRFISLLFLTSLMAGCSREILTAPPSIDITLEFPALVPTKAEVPASAEESAVHDIKIWVFRHNSSHSLVASLELNAGSLADDLPQAGSVKRYSLPVSWDFALERPRPTVDVFVLANGETIAEGLNQPLYAQKGNGHSVSTYSTVSNALFGGTVFSPGAKTASVPDSGLPMSGMGTNLAISGEEPSLSISTISLTRAVSKVRFIFCQMETEASPSELETFTVDRIVLDGEQIPTQEYVFADPAPRVGSTYVSDELTLIPPTASIAHSETPELYAYAGQDGPTYERIIKEAKDDGKLTECGSLYLRESDRKIGGTIHYTVTKGQNTDSEESRTGTARFDMKNDNEFARNHTWTVYGYYVSNRTLQLSVNVLPVNVTTAPPPMWTAPPWVPARLSRKSAPETDTGVLAAISSAPPALVARLLSKATPEPMMLSLRPELRHSAPPTLEVLP